jgi:hypothetical protein
MERVRQDRLEEGLMAVLDLCVSLGVLLVRYLTGVSKRKRELVDGGGVDGREPFSM